jgi:hypothetical protein
MILSLRHREQQDLANRRKPKKRRKKGFILGCSAVVSTASSGGVLAALCPFCLTDRNSTGGGPREQRTARLLNRRGTKIAKKENSSK